MNSDEARKIVRQELMKFRTRRYAQLSRLVGTRMPMIVVKAASGSEYQVVVQVHWDGKPNGAIRVVGLIDDGGWRAFVPMSEDFIIGPDDVPHATW